MLLFFWLGVTPSNLYTTRVYIVNNLLFFKGGIVGNFRYATVYITDIYLLLNLPHFDIVCFQTIGPLHNIFLEIAKYTVKLWKNKKILNAND